MLVSMTGLVTSNTHVKYQSFCINHSKITANDIVFQKVGQTPRPRSQGKTTVGKYTNMEAFPSVA